MAPQNTPLAALESWARDRYGLRSPLRDCVVKLINSYQETPTRPRPFVGRAALLQQLDQWLLQGEERLRLLSGAAGRGKSALLLHWLERLIARDGAVTICYLPISIRFNTASEAAGVQLLFSALCDIFSDLQKRIPQQPEIQDYLQGITWAWQQVARQPRRAFLLVIDGLDEAINQWFLGRQILPRKLPANLHVLISARHKPGHDSGRAWLEDLGIELPRGDGATAASRVLEIGTLGREAMAEAATRMGHPLDQLAQRQAFLDALYRLTDGGDPLLLTLWLGEIWKRRDGLPDLDPAALQQLRPGFEELFGLWMRDQQSIWQARGLAIRPDDFRHVMQVLAFAQGPLTLPDLIEVLGCLGNPLSWEHEKLREALETAHRLVVGDCDGYVLLHPRLAQYLQDELTADPPQRLAVRAAFRQWGARTVQRLNSGELPAEHCPLYLLAHYVAAHIGGDGEPSSQLIGECYLPLLRQGWPRAWYAREGAWQGYLHDLDRVAHRLHALNQECFPADHPTEPPLAAQLRCALLAASIRSQISNLPPALIVLLARKGVWSVDRAARVARQCEPRDRSEALTALAAVAVERGDPAGAQPLLQEAREVAAAMQDAIALSAVAAQLQGEPRHAVLQEALEAAAAIEDGECRVYTLSAVAPQLQGDSRQAVSQQALAAAVAIAEEYRRAHALSVVVARLQADSPLLQQALEAAAAIEEEHERTRALSAVAARLQADSPLLQRALEAAAAIENGERRACVLSAIAAQLQGASSRQAVIQQALEAAAAVRDHHGRARALSAAAEQLQGESRHTVLQQALEAATARDDNGWRLADALIAVVARLQPDSPLVQQALEAAIAIQDLGGRAEVLSRVAEQLQGEPRRVVLQQALEAAAAIHDPDADEDRVGGLIAVATRLEADSPLLQHALEAAAVTRNGPARHRVLSAVAARLPAGSPLWPRVLEVAAAIQDEKDQAKALGELAMQLDGEPRRTVLQQALEAAVAVQDEGSRAFTLRMLAEHLQGDRTLLQQALQAAAAIEKEEARASALRWVVAELQGDGSLVQQALEAAAVIRDPEGRAEALSAVAAQLEGEARHTALRQALEAAVAIRGEYRRANALRTVAAQLAEGSPLLQQVLEAAAAIEAGEHRAQALSAVAAQLHGDARGAVIQQALEAAVTEEDERGCAYALSSVAAQLDADSPLLQRVLEAAAAIGDETWRTEALSAVAEQLPGDSPLLPRVLEAATAIEDEDGRARVASVLAARLQADSPLLQQVLDAAAAIEEGQHRAQALSAVAAQLHGEARQAVIQQALEAAVAVENDRERAYSLSIVAGQLQADSPRLQELCQVAVAIEDEEARASALQGIVPQLARAPGLQGLYLEHALALSGSNTTRIDLAVALVRQDPSLLTYPLWFSLLSQARLSRSGLLDVMGDLTWCAIRLTGRTEQAKDVAEAIREVCRWFP